MRVIGNKGIGVVVVRKGRRMDVERVSMVLDDMVEEVVEKGFV